MTLKVDLTPELQERLRHEAERSGVPEAECIVRILDAHLPSVSRRAQAVALLQSWIDGKHADDQRETGDYLVRVLDEDRLSDRKLFTALHLRRACRECAGTGADLSGDRAARG